MLVRGCRIVEELAAVGEAVGGDVEDPHHLRLVEPDGPLAALEGRMDLLQVGPLRSPFVDQFGRKIAQRPEHFLGGGTLVRQNLAVVGQDNRKFVRVGEPAAEPDRVAIDALGTGYEPGGADVEFCHQSSIARRYRCRKASSGLTSPSCSRCQKVQPLQLGAPWRTLPT